MDHLLNDHIKKAYEQQLEYAIRAWELTPPIPQRTYTRKEKFNRQIKHKKIQLGRVLSKLANRLGYYDDVY